MGALLPRGMQAIPYPSVPCTSPSAPCVATTRYACGGVAIHDDERDERGSEAACTAGHSETLNLYGDLVSAGAASRPGFSPGTPIAYGIAKAKQADRIICPGPPPSGIQERPVCQLEFVRAVSAAYMHRAREFSPIAPPSAFPLPDILSSRYASHRRTANLSLSTLSLPL